MTVETNGADHLAEQPSNGAQRYRRLASQPENPFARLIPDQTTAVIPSFTLESGVTLYNVPVAYKTYGSLSPQGDNAMVICHALTGSADVGDWWGPLLGGPGKAFDVSRFFVVCVNSLGSPYGSASPVTAKDGDPAKGLYGPEFPLTTVRDDVNIFKLILDELGVRQIAAVIGGSMGGMLVLEFAYFGTDYVRSIIPIATSARYSAWGISWGEAQRQSIYSDPKYDDGYYSFGDPPSTGLGAARMSALLTYRSRDSFESRFGRNTPDPSRRQNINGIQRPSSAGHEHFAIHNEGHKNAGSPRNSRTNSTADLQKSAAQSTKPASPSLNTDPEFHGSNTLPASSPSLAPPISRTTSTLTGATKRTPTYFSAQSYLRYQGEKFIKRFDANCYIAITRKLDTHDVSRGRTDGDVPDSPSSSSSVPALKSALAQIEQPCLILGIQSDGLFTFAEQEELAAAIPNSVLKTIDSPEGHDAFLLEFEQVNAHLLQFMNEVLPDLMARTPTEIGSAGEQDGELGVTKSSTFGEAEVEDITAW
ncbi:homoserine O-acetyltransferase [Coniosporium apollinis CBS 100218]|uniref:Homoserine O-acetyltransferase n=1 Tax=Coniosporium apollinis (strain CBS 100218) TaxID=1168221 RepID=R7Z2K7_CONA1|nr:homoserine O-acetyltransferase [Coniosporium apollinis CBS 100218]EON68333.1 homoserine O-acetyltransferase [Coniosporium apollinis CBS 100218]